MALATAEGLAVAPRGSGSRARSRRAAGARSISIARSVAADGHPGLCPRRHGGDGAGGRATLDVARRASSASTGRCWRWTPTAAPRARWAACSRRMPAGQRRFRYGTGRDLLLGARFVQADGTVTWGGSKVVKSVTGYDMPKLLDGLARHPRRHRRGDAQAPSRPARLRARGSSPLPRGMPRRAFVAAVLASSLEPDRLAWLNAAALGRVGSASAGGRGGGVGRRAWPRP